MREKLELTKDGRGIAHVHEGSKNYKALKAHEFGKGFANVLGAELQVWDENYRGEDYSHKANGKRGKGINFAVFTKKYVETNTKQS